MKKIVIIGAGISGLAAAWFHKKRGHSVTIVEKSSRAGGWIRSFHEQGFIFEQGPRGFHTAGKGKKTLELALELGLEKELITASKKACKRYIARNGTLNLVSLPFFFRLAMTRALLRDLSTPASEREDESIADFCLRRFNTKITNNLIDPFVKGIFGANAEELSMRSCFPSVWKAEKKGSVLLHLKRQKSSLFSFRQGMQTLTDRLAEKLENSILYNASIINIQNQGVQLSDRFLEADLLVSAIAPHALCQITGRQDPFTYTSLITVNMGWNEQLLPKKGYGFLIPSSEGEKILGMTWDSEIFPEQNNGPQTRICIMMGEEGEITHAKQALKKYLGIEKEPDSQLIGKATKAIPKYLIGHHKRIKYFQNLHSFQLIGNSVNGVGINDCIESAWKSAYE